MSCFYYRFRFFVVAFQFVELFSMFAARAAGHICSGHTWARRRHGHLLLAIWQAELTFIPFADNIRILDINNSHC